MEETGSSQEDIYGIREEDEGVRLLNVKVCGASSLLKKDIFGLSDPYCRVSYCSEQEYRHDQPMGGSAVTAIKKRTLRPEWGEVFQFRVKPSTGYLLFEIFDHNKMTQDDFLGLYRFNLFMLPVNNLGQDIASAPVHDCLLKQRTARSRVKGTLHLQFAYQPSEDADTNSGSIHRQISQDEEVGDWESLQDEPPLPEGWEERVDFSGRIVYVDHSNRTVSLDRPTEPAYNRAPRRSLLQRQVSDFENRRQISDDTLDVGELEPYTVQQQVSQPEEVPGPSAPSSASPSAPSTTPSSTPSTAPSSSTTEESPLPEGWECLTDFSGRTVYVNHRLRHTQFERPTVPGEEDDFGFEQLQLDLDVSDTGPGPSQPPTSLDLSGSSAGEPESPLPAGWRESRDPTTGKTFYIDHNSRTTSWIRPRTRTDGLCAASGALPAHWEMRYTKAGRPFFINHRTKETSWHDPRQDELLPAAWEMRVHADGRVFYVDHNTKSTQWEDPRKTKVSSGPAIQYSRDYKIKYENFKANLPAPPSSTGKIEVKVRRPRILEDSYYTIMSKEGAELRKRLWISFEGEPGLDYGGVAREWFYTLSREMFNPYYGLWEYSAIDNYTLQINPNSELCNPEHKTYFKFFGRICGMAVYHGKLVDGFFIRPFYKMILGKSVLLEDMAEVDIETYNSLKWVIDNDPEDLCLTFSAQEDKFGEMVETPLVTNGENIDVTNFNKLGYVKAYIGWKFADRIKEQIESFKSGFNDVIPLSNLAVFDEKELEYLVCGITQIDVEDWCTYTVFKGGYSPTHHLVVWWWKAVRSYDNEFRARLLQFVTGTSRVPMNGFRELQGSNGPQQFCIEKWGTPNDLPRAHTCFNRIDLPPYNDYHTLREKLRLAVECTGGFDID